MVVPNLDTLSLSPYTGGARDIFDPGWTFGGNDTCNRILCSGN